MSVCYGPPGNETLLSWKTSRAWPLGQAGCKAVYYVCALSITSSPGVMFMSLLVIIVPSVALAVGLPGNSFVVWRILVKMRKRSVTALLVLHLALADLAVLLTAPFFLYYTAQGTWTFGLAGCRLFHYVCGVSMYASVLLITAMSLDRSLATVAWRALGGIWVVSVLLATPVILYRKVTLGPDNRSLICFPKYPSEAHRAFHLFFEVVTGFLLPFLAVVASYSDIWRRLRSAAAPGPQALITLAFLSSSVYPVLYACAAGGLLRSAGIALVAKLEAKSTRPAGWRQRKDARFPPGGIRPRWPDPILQPPLTQMAGGAEEREGKGKSGQSGSLAPTGSFAIKTEV
ncbi:hypothetical protein E2I00_017505 [Balaenoptera physalus]|uniref:G-protein coupled receptors family 1 profile domain-containing protein n=1 Tax=Balaenoptera physalus TaxID=9770 RepID=A0A643BRI8_BALPH|nr:hypothetical protein E2I00_017505 [Balaenoptera physalus]